MRIALVAFLAGLVFALGLGLGGMTQPAKIVAFLDVFGRWDPSLAFVMAGAVGVHALAYRLAGRLRSPLLGLRFEIPTRRDVDRSLVLGSALFGVGWGLGGYCPGPGLTALFSGDPRPVVFVIAMIAGMVIERPVIGRWVAARA